MKDQAAVVVIGGGVVGCIAFHLAKMGCEDVVLVEKGELTSGTTFHSVGLVSQFRTSPTLMRLMNSSIHLYNELKEDTGGAVGWYPVGSLRLASSPERLKAIQRQVGTAQALGLNIEIISPAEASTIFPTMTVENLYGAVHIPDDGWLEPNGITAEFARRARRMGAEIQTNVRVIGIELSPQGEISAVETENGKIRTPVVVNAAGQWAPQIAEMVGIDYIPITPLMHQYLITRPIPGHELPSQTPVLRDPDNLFYMRAELGGFLVGGFELNPRAWSVNGVAWDFTQKLLPADWDLFEEVMEGAIRRVPILANAQIVKLVNGPEGITPDGFYCLGPVPGVRWFYIAAGMSLNGIAGAGGVGQAMARWILEGDPGLDMHEFNVRRFGPQFADRDYRVQRAREVYRFYYHMRFPFDEAVWGRPLRTSPVYARLQERGAVFGEKNGWERVNYFEPGQPWRRYAADQRKWGWGRPPYFERVGEEHAAVRERVGLLDMTSFGKIDLRGPGAAGFLQRLSANNVQRPVGSIVYTQFLNPGGGIESDLTITRWGEEHFRITSGTATVSNDLGWIQLHLPDDGSVMVQDVTDKWACLALWGPYARDVLQSVTDGDLSNSAFPYMTARVIQIGSAEVGAQRLSYAGELGWELYVSPEDAITLWDLLMTAGAPFDIQPVGYMALDSLRLEKGYRVWGTDITPAENPYEAGLGFCVRLENGGEFIGREALLRARETGIAKKLCTLRVNDALQVIYGGEAVHIDGQLVGRVRSGGFGYTVGTNIALSYLPLEMSVPGTAVEIGIFGDRIAAVVAPDALYDPDARKMKR